MIKELGIETPLAGLSNQHPEQRYPVFDLIKHAVAVADDLVTERIVRGA
jgi:hypothetical protein